MYAERLAQGDAVQRPNPAHVIGETAALLDPANQPLAAEHAVINAVLVDPRAEAGRSKLEGHLAARIKKKNPRRWGSILPRASS
jgi:hypothetical protein